MQTQSVLNAVLEFEQNRCMIDTRLLQRTMDGAVKSSGTLQFLIFSCLTTEEREERLKPDVFETSFFAKGHVQPRKSGFYGGHASAGWEEGCPGKLGHYPRRVLELNEKINLPSVTRVILVDTEPRRTWGWKTGQSQLTDECSKMVKQAEESRLMPINEDWSVILWSELERLYTGSVSFEDCLVWARTRGPQTIRVQEQTKHLAGFSERYHFPLGVEETAIRQVAAYAWEGIVLEQILPNVILLQTEKPWKEKDCLYQMRRGKKTPLCIIHPFG